MTCPFLREARVRTCRTAPVRKLIPSGHPGIDEKCSGPAYPSCPGYRGPQTADVLGPVCPYLDESMMQYCCAAPVPKFVPYSESLLSRCGNDSYRYCELYVAMAHPPQTPADEVDGVRVPSGLRYSANHMWLDETEDGSCHAGIDAFLSRALGPVDRINYVWMSGDHRPAAILTVAGMDLEVVFPNALRIERCNLYLRANPSRLASDPYTEGWLFEGTPLAGTSRGLIDGGEARAWMEQEERQMNQ